MLISPSADTDRLGFDIEGRLVWYTLDKHGRVSNVGRVASRRK